MSCYLSLFLHCYRCWTVLAEDRFGVCECLRCNGLDDVLWFPWFIGVVCVSICFWDLPGDVLTAPAYALCGWKGVILSLCMTICGSTWTDTLHAARFGLLLSICVIDVWLVRFD